MIDLGSVVQKPARFTYTFVRATIDPIFKSIRYQTKDITLIAMAWHDHESQARARLPWDWYQALILDMRVVRI